MSARINFDLEDLMVSSCPAITFHSKLILAGQGGRACASCGTETEGGAGTAAN